MSLCYCTFHWISIHALREEGDAKHAEILAINKISIHALREEGDDTPLSYSLVSSISIHALREEGDSTALPVAATTAYFYPRPPRGGRPLPVTLFCLLRIFLSTPSARRATIDLS